MVERNWQRILFKCKICGNDFWMECNLNTYIVSEKDLICDDHFTEDGELVEGLKEE